MVLNAFPCDSQHFIFLLDEDFATDITNHMIFLQNRERRDNGYWVEKQAKVSV